MTYMRMMMAIGFIIGLSQTAMGAKVGQISFEKRSHDFEHVVRGQVLKYRFKFKNSGEGPLRIEGLHAACGCTAVEADKGKIYQPNETGYVDVVLDTTDFDGSMMKVVTVMTNETITPDRTLTVRAKVFSEFEVLPPLVDYGDVVSKDGAVRLVKILPLANFPLQVTSVDHAHETLEVDVKSDKNEWMLTVRLKPNQKPGFFKDTVRIKTNSKHLPQLAIPVRGTIRGNIAVAPAYLEFGAVTQEQRVKRDLTLSGLEDFEIVDTKAEVIVNGIPIKDSAEFVSIASAKDGSSRKKVGVELKNASPRGGSVHGKLYLKTNDPGQPQVEVDFYAFFR